MTIRASVSEGSGVVRIFHPMLRWVGVDEEECLLLGVNKGREILSMGYAR